MLKTVLILFPILFATALATAPARGDQTVPHANWAGGAQDLLGATKVDLEPKGDSVKPAFTVSCTDSHGETLQKTDAGYDECLKSAAKKPPPSAPPSLKTTIGN